MSFNINDLFAVAAKTAIVTGGSRGISKMMAHTLAQYQDRIEQENPMGRIGSPQDMAGLALFLASAATTSITTSMMGQVIALDGGQHLGAAET